MFGNYVYEKSSAQYNDRIIIIDNDNLEEITNYSASFKEHDFKVIKYKDDLHLLLQMVHGSILLNLSSSNPSTASPEVSK